MRPVGKTGRSVCAAYLIGMEIIPGFHQQPAAVFKNAIGVQTNVENQTLTTFAVDCHLSHKYPLWYILINCAQSRC